MTIDFGLAAMPVLFLAGAVGGAASAIAGGASFFTFPALILAGLPPLVANATNFVGLVPANLAALPAYRHELRAIGRGLVAPFAAGGLGGIAGALLLIGLGADVFTGAVPWLIGFATLLFALAPRLRLLIVRRTGGRQGHGLAGLASLFLLSVYGGYFGAGLGQIMLAALILMGEGDFHRANALKNAVIGFVSVIACTIYVAGGSVHWPYALVVMAGATLGGYAGGALARKVPVLLLRRVVIGVGVVLTAAAFLKAL